MTIELTEHIHTAKRILSGHESAIPVDPGQVVKIETSPGGVEIITTPACPVGKNWSARIILEITETDAG